MKMICNLHTHTFRCNHASGTEREYIENSIAGGIETIGFADHAPYVFPEGYYSGFRMRPDLQEDYVRTLLDLREEYKGKIDIKIGYEAEYYPKFFDKTVELFRRYPVDYLILGQHFIRNEFDGVYSGQRTDSEDLLRDYVNQVCEAIDTGLYTYVAHPDLVAFSGDQKIYEHHYGKLIDKAGSAGLPLEINCLGIRDNRHYPSDRFFELCGRMGAEVCVGSDAHSADVAYDSPSYEKADQIIKKYGLKFNPKPELKPV
ncbi:MAG: histidinol-phosphatase [Clostridia bacterium]|nr:histidinol-phosphatase [Clostridia bacterium]